MTSPFDNAISAGLKTRRAIAAVTGTYSDGDNSGQVPAVRGKPNVKTAEAVAVQMNERYVDWLIPVAELAAVTPSLTLPPKRGHTFTVGAAVYTVTTFEGMPAWEWVDPGETEYRIHTIKTGGS